MEGKTEGSGAGGGAAWRETDPQSGAMGGMTATQIHVGPGEIQGACGDAELCCPAVAGGIALAVYDPHAHVGACGHFILPKPSEAFESERSTKYVATGVHQVFAKLEELGGMRARASVAIAGGAAVMPPEGKGARLELGARNLQEMHDFIEHHRLKCEAEDVGGQFGRIMHLSVADGVVRVRTGTSTNRTLCRLRGA